MKIIPCTLRTANDFVELHHRHNGRTGRDGGRFALGLASGDETIGIAIVGNPLSATYMDGVTAEVLRVCVGDAPPKNGNSMLYGACRRVWFEMGGTRLITYTLTSESGASLRASGWTCEAEIRGHNPKTWGKIDDGSVRTEAAVIALTKLRWQVLRHDWVPLPVQSRPAPPLPLFNMAEL